MTAPVNTTTTLVSAGNREDLEAIIYRVAVEDTPFTSAIGTTKAEAITHEWQTENLAAPSAANAALEGDDVSTLGAPNLTSRVSNKTQIGVKTGGVSGTQETVNKAGRGSEITRQKLLKGLEILRDYEARFIGNFASNDESGATPRRAGGALAWLTTNTSRGAGGANGGFSAGFVTAATNGAQRTFTEAQVKAVMASAFANGGKPSMAFMSATQKQQFSAFTGIADIRGEVKGKDMGVITAGAEVYVSDFGALTLMPHPYGLTRDCLFIDPDYWAVATLRPIKTEELAKTGDSERFLVRGEKTLVCRNERSSAVIADLT